MKKEPWQHAWGTTHNLQLDDLAIDLDGTDFLKHRLSVVPRGIAQTGESITAKGVTHKIDTDCANVCLGVGIVSKTQEQAGLANA